MIRDYFEEEWTKKFIKLNKRKPTRLEALSFRVGWNAREDYEFENNKNNLNT